MSKIKVCDMCGKSLQDSDDRYCVKITRYYNVVVEEGEDEWGDGTWSAEERKRTTETLDYCEECGQFMRGKIDHLAEDFIMDLDNMNRYGLERIARRHHIANISKMNVNELKQAIEIARWHRDKEATS